MTSAAYLRVIEDVINNVRQEFTNGPGEDLLMQLQANWEARMVQAGVLYGPAVDLNIPVAFPAAPVQVPNGQYHQKQPSYDHSMNSHQYQHQCQAGGSIPQQDGAGDTFEGASSSGSFGVNEEKYVKQSPLMNEEDDDDDLDGDYDEKEEELNTENLILAQFSGKVKRTKAGRWKGRWNCTLSHGIMHINDRDILFNNATGQFDFNT